VTTTGYATDDTLVSSTSDPLLLGSVVDGRYALRRVLGRGAAAVVFAAEHVRVRRLVALKLPLHDVELHALLCARLRREIDLLSRVRHRAIVDALDAGEHEGLPYLAMELLEGRTLAGLIAARGKLNADEAIKIGIELAEGLAAVHAAGIVHRDVKPLNVLVTHAPLRQVHLCDFGIARQQAPLGGEHPRLTEQGAFVGTIEYMPMEALAASANADHRVDVYALGITLFECLTGNVPVEGPLGQLVSRITAGPLPAVSELRPDVPVGLSQIVARCIAPDYRERFATALEVAHALRDCASGPTEGVDLLRSTAVSAASAGSADERSESTSRRKHARAPFVALASLQRGDEPATTGRVEDLSRGGMLLLCKSRYDAGDIVLLRFALPISGRVLANSATVRWCREARNGIATGLEFGELPEAAKGDIDRYVTLMEQPS